jgi:hypothetical protein
VTDFVRIKLPEPHYSLFNTTRSDLPEVICVNDALLSFQHTDIFRWHLRISIDATELADNGMPTEAESAVLFEFGDRFEKGLEGDNALFLARSTWNGMRTLYFQVYDPEVANEFLQGVLAEEPATRPWEFEMREDPDWTDAGYIFQLFPIARGADA